MANPESFAQVITRDLPAQLSFLSLYAVARTVVTDGDYSEGRRLLELALGALGDTAALPVELQWAAVGAYFRLGWLYHQPPENHTLAAEAYSEAIEIKAISQEPPWAAPFNNRGNAYLALGLTNLAILDYSEAIRIDPSYADAFYNRGLAHSELNQIDDAISDFTEAMRLNPSYVKAYFQRGYAQFELGEYEAAIADYTEVIKLDPENGFAYHNRGSSYYNTHDYEQALKDYEQYLRLVPDADNREDVEQVIQDLRARLGQP
jgi:tetratricopeptide (TPR) repeat protein